MTLTRHDLLAAAGATAASTMLSRAAGPRSERIRDRDFVKAVITPEARSGVVQVSTIQKPLHVRHEPLLQES